MTPTRTGSIRRDNSSDLRFTNNVVAFAARRALELLVQDNQVLPRGVAKVPIAGQDSFRQLL